MRSFNRRILPRVSRRMEITAVHEDDTKALLDRLGVAPAYRDGSLFCSICGSSVREDGLGAVGMKKGNVVVSCGRIECLDTFHE